MADQPQPWESEPQGITFRYFDRRPIGLLIGGLHDDTKLAALGLMNGEGISEFQCSRFLFVEVPIGGECVAMSGLG